MVNTGVRPARAGVASLAVSDFQRNVVLGLRMARSMALTKRHESAAGVKLTVPCCEPRAHRRSMAARRRRSRYFTQPLP